MSRGSSTRPPLAHAGAYPLSTLTPHTHTAAATVAATGSVASAASRRHSLDYFDDGGTSMPPILYQLQRGVRRTAPTQTQQTTQSNNKPHNRPRTHAPTQLDRLPLAPSSSTRIDSTNKLKTHPPIVQTDIGCQTRVTDLPTRFVEDPSTSCGHCICCTIYSETIRSVEDYRQKYEEMCLTKKRLESEMEQLIMKIRTLKKEKEDATKQTHANNNNNNSHAHASQLAEQENIIRQLRHQHTLDQQHIERLQLQVTQLKRDPPPSSSSSSVVVLGLDGLSALQRHQRDLRDGAENALLKLQQLFPDQKFGT